jgi:FixJ family two-component response regulator
MGGIVGRKYTARVDGNQAAITGALRQAGCLVQTTHTIGRGFPDLLCYYPTADRMFLLEVKMPGAKLTQDEVQWHAKWQDAPVYVITGVEEIPALLQTIEGDAT